MVYLIISIILLILLLLLFLPLKIVISLESKKINLSVKLSGITVYKFLPSKKKKEKTENTTEERVKSADKNILSLSKKIKFYAEISRFAAKLIKKYISIDNISIKMEVGTSDAASTAVYTGILWGTLYRALGIIGSVAYIRNNDVDITPAFNESKFSVKGKCIIKSRLAYIIFIAIIISIKIKSLKGKED